MFLRSKTLSFITLVCILTILLSNCAAFGSTGGAVTIAVVEQVPTLENGSVNPQSIYAGVLLAAEQVNAQGGVGGQKILVKSYVDNGDPATAAVRANEIIQSNVIAVVGHSSIETSNAAAKIYNQNQIPVIGVIPGDKRLVNDYPYYFNLSYTANQEAAYLANYDLKVLEPDKSADNKGRNRVTIIYTNDEYGKALKSQFTNTFKGLGGKSITFIVVEKNEASIENIASTIAIKNSETENPGTLFIATDENTAATLLFKMRRKGVNYPMMGASNLGGATFQRIIKSQNEEKAQGGYFTNGILATRSLIFDSANEQASLFFDAYQTKFDKADPGDLPANGYDAALTLFAAIQRSQPSATSMADDRNGIYQALVGMDGSKVGVQGLTGRIYFDPTHKTVRGPHFGIYQNGQMVSAATQFEPVTNPEQEKNGQVITVNGEKVFKVNMVYAGIDVLNISDIDIKTSSYKMDFYLWFRFPATINTDEIKPDQFVFINALSLDDGYNVPASEVSDDRTGLKTITYRVAGIFKNQFSFYEYPFDVQSLPIQFRNDKATSSSIQYAVDRIGMQYPNDAALEEHFKENGAFGNLYGWNAHGSHAEQVTFSTTSTLGNPQNFEGNAATDFSLIRLAVEIKRDSLQYIIKSLLPLLITLVLAYITFFLPIGHSERLGVGSTALLTTAFFHISLADSLPQIGYTVAMEFLFYASYAVSALIVLLETLSIRLEKQSEGLRSKVKKDAIQRRREILNTFGRIAYPVILLTAITAGALVYFEYIHLGPESDVDAKSPVRPFVVRVDKGQGKSAQSEVQQGSAKGPVVLDLATWRPEDAASFQVILDEFHTYAKTKKNVDITVRYAPVMSTNYDAILNKQLNDGAGPDLFYVRPFSVDGYIIRYLMPLSDMNIGQSYAEVKSQPWLDARTKIYYALPFAGVVQGVYYNKDLFSALRLEPPKTWDDLLKISSILKEKSITPIANTLNENEDSEMFQGILANFVGGVKGRADFTTSPGSLCFTNTRIVNAFGALNDLKPYLYLPNSVDDRKSDKSKELFFGGQAAMLFGGSWDVNTFSKKDLSFEWSVFPVPAPHGDPTVIFHPDSGIGINKNSTHKAEAQIFLDWLRSDKGVNLVVKNLPGFYPLRNDVKSQSVNDVDAKHAQEFLQLTQKLTDARWAETEISDHVPSAQNIIRAALNDIAYNGLSPRDAAKRLQSGLGEWYEPAQSCKP